MMTPTRTTPAEALVLAPLGHAGKTAGIPAKRTRFQPSDDGRHLDAARHLVERRSTRLKQHRALATGYDQCATTALGAMLPSHRRHHSQLTARTGPQEISG